MAATDETTGASTSKEDVLALVKENDIQFVRLWFTDIFGQLKSFAIGREELAGALDEGMGFDGSSITGFNRIEESDMIAMPDPSTFKILPWRSREHKVGRVFCDVLTPDGLDRRREDLPAAGRGRGPDPHRRVRCGGASGA